MASSSCDHKRGHSKPLKWPASQRVLCSMSTVDLRRHTIGLSVAFGAGALVGGLAVYRMVTRRRRKKENNERDPEPAAAVGAIEGGDKGKDEPLGWVSKKASPQAPWAVRAPQPPPYGMASADQVFSCAPAALKSPYFFSISAVVPRPIAFVATVSKEGNCNLAPFSYFGLMGASGE